MYRDFTVVLSGVVILLSVVIVALWHVALGRIRQLRAALDHVQRSASDAGASADMLAAEAKLQKRRADEFFAIIEGVERERDNWQRLYRQSAQAAGAAQAWLVRDLTAAVRIGNQYAERLRAKGEKVAPVAVDRQLQHVIEEFSQEHVLGHPELQSTDAMALARQVEQDATVTALPGPTNVLVTG